MKKVAAARKSIPFDFAIEALSPASPHVKPMFGAYAVYIEDKIVIILRDSAKNQDDNGIWLATTPEHHESLRREFPNMRSIRMFGPGETGWQVLPVGADDFEESVLRACELALGGDPRIGKIPKSRIAARSSKKAPSKRKGKKR